MKKNDIIKLNITDIGINGEGIGKTDGFPFFVKNALPGDEVEAVITKLNKNFGYAKMTKLVVPGEARVEPSCRVAERCGGCQIMQLDYEKQLELKENLVANDLKRIGKVELSCFEKGGMKNVAELHPIIGMDIDKGCDLNGPLHFRNKVQFPVGKNKEGKAVAGFYAGRTHFIVETSDCPVSDIGTELIVESICDFINKNSISVYDEKTGLGLVRHVLIRSGFRTGQMMVCLVINGTGLDDKSRKESLDNAFVKQMLSLDLSKNSKCPQGRYIASIMLNINKKKTNVILGDKTKTLYGQPYIEDIISLKQQDLKDLKFRISALSFYQVNPVQTEKLYSKALEYADLKGDEIVWDLYCGIGTISLFLAQKAKKVYGVEIVNRAIDDAKENARLNDIDNVEFICGDSAQIFKKYIKNGERTEFVDLVVLDPPRKGCDRALLDAVKEAAPEKIVYVSCDPATLARDLAILSANTCENEEAYRVEKIQPVDMFPHTRHVETVVLMTRTGTGNG